METTPSLACANKCVFCWRHHSNPVGTEWKWKMDPAEKVLEGALENHYKMIKQMKGIGGFSEHKKEDLGFLKIGNLFQVCLECCLRSWRRG